MDTNKLLRDAGINDPAAFQYAAELARQGQTEKEVLKDTIRVFPSAAKIMVNNKPLPYAKFGEVGTDIPFNAIDQMNEVMRIPPALKGALMPDAHKGYAMPIGGVVGMLNAVSPSFVGYDIACRMTVSFLDISPEEFMKAKLGFTPGGGLFEDMQAVSSFGIGSHFEKPHDHEVMHDPLWNQLPHLKALKDKAQNQLGSSGGGNHFFKLATYYQKLAEKEIQAQFRGIKKGYEWLNMEHDTGREYWKIMQLMGRYAQACHHIIHDSFIKRTGISGHGRMENHHNFAWVENGMYVHRKGATPAAQKQSGIIPGTSGTTSFLVEGLGNEESLNSSSHGAGRPFSRTEAKRRHDDEAFKKHWTETGVLYDSVGNDETYQAYKDIERVIKVQEGSLIKVIARMKPEIVLMGGKADDGD